MNKRHLPESVTTSGTCAGIGRVGTEAATATPFHDVCVNIRGFNEHESLKQYLNLEFAAFKPARKDCKSRPKNGFQRSSTDLPEKDGHEHTELFP